MKWSRFSVIMYVLLLFICMYRIFIISIGFFPPYQGDKRKCGSYTTSCLVRIFVFSVWLTYVGSIEGLDVSFSSKIIPINQLFPHYQNSAVPFPLSTLTTPPSRSAASNFITNPPFIPTFAHALSYSPPCPQTVFIASAANRMPPHVASSVCLPSAIVTRTRHSW